MSQKTILDFTAEMLIESWLSDTPIARLLSEPLSRIIRATLDQVINTVPGKTGTSDRFVRNIFSIPNDLKNPNEAADYLSRMLRGWLPDELSTLKKYFSSEKDKKDNTEDFNPKKEERINKQDLLEAILKNSNFQDISIQNNFKNLINSLSGISSKRKWDRDTVKKLLEEIIRRLGVYQKVQQKLQVEFSMAVAKLSQRIPIAASLSAADLILPFFESTKSDWKLGIQVHKKLQDRYIDNYDHNTIIAERYVYDNKRIIGTIKEFAWNYGYSDFFALMMSRFSPFTPTGNIRDDVVDYTTGDLWEIKPMRSAVEGVCQEVFYTTAYNCFTIYLEDVWQWPALRKKFFDGKGWNENLLSHFEPSDSKKGTYIKPFCIDQLPGLVLYLVIKSRPELIEALAETLMAFLLNYIKSELEKLKKVGQIIWEGAKRVWNTLEEAIEAIVTAFLDYLEYILIGIAVLLAIVLLFKLVVAAAAAAALITATGIIIFTLLPESKETNSSNTTLNNASTTAENNSKEQQVNIIFGNCMIVGVPHKLITPQFFNKISQSTSLLLDKGILAAIDETNKMKSETISSS